MVRCPFASTSCTPTPQVVIHQAWLVATLTSLTAPVPAAHSHAAAPPYLPIPQATPGRVQQWVRLRLRQAGLPRPEKVFMVSAKNGLGIKEMMGTIRDEMGFRADLWVVGAQNGEAGTLPGAGWVEMGERS